MLMAKCLRLLFCLVLSLGVTSSTPAQTRVNASGTGGLNTIQGQIFTAGGRPIDSPITIKLRSISFGELSLITDQNGGFAFKNLSAGNYEVVVLGGDDFEPAHEYVTIDPDIRGPVGNPFPPSPKIFTVPIYLQAKRPDDQRTGVVDARFSALPKDAVRHFRKGEELIAAGKAVDAEKELLEAIRIYPAFSAAHVKLGELLLKRGQVDKAIEALTAALNHDDKNFDARVTLGIALFAKKELGAAEKELKLAAGLNSSAVTPHYYLGLLYVQTKNLDSAQSELETAQKLGAGNKFPMLHRMLGGIYVTKKMNDRAVKELETYLTLDPNAKDADRLRTTIADLKGQTN
jgi:tetratricopeptide (TPR) repeat protein